MKYGVYTVHLCIHYVSASLLRLFDIIIQGENVSENTYFIKVFLEEVLRSGQELTEFVVQFIPARMVSSF